MECGSELALLKLEIELLEQEIVDFEKQRSRKHETLAYEYDLDYTLYMQEELARKREELIKHQWKNCGDWNKG